MRILDFVDGFESSTEPTAEGIAASSVTNTPSGNLTSENQQDVNNELQADIDTRATSQALNDHTGDTTNAHPASAISVTPTGNIASENVQAALEEIQTQIDGVVSASAPDSSNELSNLALTCSVSSNALTIALKGKDGSNPSGSNIVKIGFRSATAATGTYNQRTVTSALSTVISSGSTAGHSSATPSYIYVYALDNAGTVELAWSTTRFDDGTIQSTTAEGGAGGADSSSTLYSTTARSNVPIRLIGRLTSNQTTAGTWAAVPTEISLNPFIPKLVFARYTTAAGQSFAAAGTVTIIDYGTKVIDKANAVTTGASWKFTATEPGVYEVNVFNMAGPVAWIAADNFALFLYKNGSQHSVLARDLGKGSYTDYLAASGSTQVDLAAGEYIDIRASISRSGGNTSLIASGNYNHVNVSYLGRY